MASFFILCLRMCTYRRSRTAKEITLEYTENQIRVVKSDEALQTTFFQNIMKDYNVQVSLHKKKLVAVTANNT